MSDKTVVATLLTQLQEKSKAINPTPHLPRSFKNVDKSRQSNSLPSEATSGDDPGVLRIFQWNLLAQGLCQSSDGFVLCPSAALEWNYRQHHILEELLTYSPDIYCLQELDQFFFVLEKLGKIGFTGAFCPKPDSPCLYIANNNGPDGCAIFWREDKFTLVSQENIVLQDDVGDETNQVALLCRLRVTRGDLKGKEIFVATTHLKSKKNYQELRFQQGKFLEKVITEKSNGLPVILCGDFNAEPDERVIEVMKKSQLCLTSAYTLLSEDGSEPPYTTWKIRGDQKGRKEEICHTIDYIFYSTQDFVCCKLLEFPSKEEMGDWFLPSFGYPSDHLSLVADFRLVSK